MEINNEIKNNILSLDDKSLKKVIDSLANAAGIDNSRINISAKDMEKIRGAIRDASDKDTSEALRLLGGENNAKRIINSAKKQANDE